MNEAHLILIAPFVGASIAIIGFASWLFIWVPIENKLYGRKIAKQIKEMNERLARENLERARLE